jgi:hypothetical protein
LVSSKRSGAAELLRQAEVDADALAWPMWIAVRLRRKRVATRPV